MICTSDYVSLLEFLGIIITELENCVDGRELSGQLLPNLSFKKYWLSPYYVPSVRLKTQIYSSCPGASTDWHRIQRSN